MNGKQKKGLPIGIDDFKKLIEEEAFFIDKSLLIKELIDDSAEIKLITRPRRFGKTLNLSMIKYFFEKSEADNSKLFTNLKIWQTGETYTSEQGKYPVIFITLKEVKENTMEGCLENFKTKIMDLFDANYYLIENSNINEMNKERFLNIMKGTANIAEYKSSLYFLSKMLFRYHNSPVIILIDEYDTMINNAVIKGYFAEATDFMRVFLGSALKGNTYLKMGVVTGIYRVAKEIILSDINNLKVCSIMENIYSDKFGFLEEEIRELVTYYGMVASMDVIKAWYNGYIFGDDKVIYNPWSVLNYIDNKKLQPYWVNTSTNEIIQNIFYKTDSKVKEKLLLLIQNKAIENVIINPSINFRDIVDKHTLNEDVLWSFLLVSGYLKLENLRIERGRTKGEIKIPNEEILVLYEDMIDRWFNNEEVSSSLIKDMLQELVEGNLKTFEKAFRYLINKTFSYFDVGMNNSENFYHAFTLGLLVNLDDKYRILSNRESGKGRPDVIIIPKDATKKAVVLEFKTSDEESELEADAEFAVKQIEEKDYMQEAINSGIKEIVKIGIAFCGKEICIKSLIC
jgi:Protein of unknown function (DUF1703)./Predicted AAA-ATPase.